MKKILLLLSIVFVSLFSNAAQIGNLKTYNFAGGSLPAGVTATTTGATTLTYNTNSLNVSGGSGAALTFSEYITLGQYLYGDALKIDMNVKPRTLGLGFSIVLVGVQSNAVQEFCRFNSTTGVMTFGVTTDLSTATALTGYTVSANNNINLSLEYSRVAYTMTARVANVNGSAGTEQTITSAIPTNPQGWQVRICFHGGAFDLFNVNETVFSKKKTKLLLIGDSNTYSIVANSWNNSYPAYVAKALTGGQSLETFAWIGAKASDINTFIADIILYQPDFVVFMLGTNEKATSVPLATYLSNSLAIINAIVNATDANGVPIGTKVFWMDILPNSNGYGSDINTVWNPAIQAACNGTNIIYLQHYVAMSNGSTSLNASYDNGDGVHLNTAGNGALGLIVINAIKDYIKL